MRAKELTECVDILGVSVHCINKDDLLKQAVDWAHQTEKKTITYVNAHCLNIAVRDKVYRRILNQSSLVYSDGTGVVWAGMILANKKLYKVTGRAWIDNFCRLCQEQNISLYFLGGKPGIADEAKKRLQTRFPKVNIVGVCDGYFQGKGESAVLEELMEKKPDVLLVGMGVPRQEKWIDLQLNEIPVKVYWSVGALFDYVVGVEAPVPGWMEQLALEWLWRMMVDPWGKWKRYLIGTPLFISRVLKQKIKNGKL